MTCPVEDVAGDVSLHVLAASLQSHTDNDDHEHDEETLNAPKDIDHLGCSKGNAACQGARHDVANIEETEFAESRGDERVERSIDGVLQECHKLDQVQARLCCELSSRYTCGK